MQKLCLCLFVLLFSKSINAQLISYYFPFMDFDKEKTYLYVNQNDTIERYYWKMHTTITNDDTFFYTKIVDKDNIVIEELKEKIVNNSSILTSYTLYRYTELKEQIKFNCKIVDSEIFLNNQEYLDTIKWKVEFIDNYNSKTYYFSKNRKLVKSKIKNQIDFIDYMNINQPEIGYNENYLVLPTYKKNIGLISYVLRFKNFEKLFKLVKVF